ncbi:MAG: T9SS type A sorting domain-containing protein [Bacteroidetes bacterium]|nr:T9SS type A sorting domain-containing protein [Bacteroidota bacterium]
MKRATKIASVFLCIALGVNPYTNWLFAQQNPFIAGLINEEISYCDIEPDSVIHLETSNSLAGGLFGLDLDSDGVFDFDIWVVENTHLGWWEKYFLLGKYDEAQICFADSGAFTLNSDTVGYFPIAKPFLVGDTIEATGFYTHDYTYLSNFTLDPFGWNAYNLYWKGIGPACVGLKIIKPNETILGWIRIELPEDAGTELIVYDYAVNKPDLYTTVADPLNPFFQISPNPVDGILMISTQLHDHLNGSSFQVYDLSGQIHLLPFFKGHGRWSLCTEKLHPGMYVLEIKNQHTIERYKFIKM